MGRADAAETRNVPAASFSRFAADDLSRWRALRNCSVSPGDGRWGEGRVAEVRWEGRSDLPEDRGAIYLRVEYADGLRARVNARAFSRLHRSVRIESGLADFVERWFGDPDAADREDDARVAAVTECDRKLREEQDEARRRHVQEMRRRIRQRDAE
jgi:hypothetical protein